MMVWRRSKEFIPAALTKVPVTVDPDGVRFCLSTSRKRPVISGDGLFDGFGAVVETDENTGVQTANCLYDGESDPLEAGQYTLWLEITTTDETVVFPVDQVEIYDGDSV